jgi:hypothetical protein
LFARLEPHAMFARAQRLDVVRVRALAQRLGAAVRDPEILRDPVETGRPVRENAPSCEPNRQDDERYRR